MWKYMINNPDVFVSTNHEGIERVQAENYAFLMESTTIEYTVQQKCNLTQIGGHLDYKGYGIGLPEGSPHRERFSEIILDLQEKGAIQESYDKWWKGKGKCPTQKKDPKPNPLDLTNVGGIFVVLLGGVFLSLLVAILEFLWHARKNHANRRHSVWWELIKELRFSIQCGASNRKALIARRCSQCTVDNDDIELNEIPQANQLLHRTHSNRSSSSISANTTGSNLQVSKRRTTTERTGDSDKFDTLLMLAAERTNYLDNRRKKYFYDSHIDRKHRHLSSSPQRKDIPLVLIEKYTSDQESNQRPHQVHFSTNGDSTARSSLRIPHNEDDDDVNAADISSGSTSSMNLHPLPRVSRL
ncbi:unnamed protein product [Rotaria sp. Silwood1]|nr:unnamed protein product [Rotaria sp. Silwood1]